MEYLAIAVVFGVMMACFAFLDEKRKEQRRELNGIYEELAQYNSRANAFEMLQCKELDRVSALEAALPALEEQIKDLTKRNEDLTKEVKELTEQVKITDQQEKRVLEGMGNILNYNLDIARKAASANVRDEE